MLPSGWPRRHWRGLAVAFGRMRPSQLKRHWQVGQHLIQSNGVTYNVYGDPRGMERPWVMDPVPLVLDPEEWRAIEAAIVQRATLLNAILQDLYGDQRLVREGQLPPALLFANPNFLRPCAGIRPPGGVYLHSYAADLARSPEGRWWVIGDRTQAPSGVGYALENRLVSGRTLATVFNQSRVRPLNRFFEIQRDALQALAPNKRTHPRVVLLTPGPNNETYFEQSFLARHWGFPLVEGADLTVRNNHVFLKTLQGLEPVDVVLRRMDDSFCDPLELRGDSLLGIPGFTQAVRSGHVAVANALGSGLFESSSHMAFLPGLSRWLLGEELKMPSVATWWCGQDGPRSYVSSHLDELVIKPTFPRLGQHPRFPEQLDAAARQALLREIETRPADFVAQERVTLSTAPVYNGGDLDPRHVVLRVFAAWDGSAYTVLPGGLTRASTSSSSPLVSMQLGGGSKDTWILCDGDQVNSLPAVVSSAVAPTPLPSRLADNFFWLGRYTERVENGIRLVRGLLPSLSGEEDFGRTISLDTAVQILVALEFLPAELTRTSVQMKRWQVERHLTNLVYDPGRNSSIGWNLKNVRRTTWPLKERLSADTWRVLQQLEIEFNAPAPADPQQRLNAMLALLDRAIVHLSAFSGLWMENTTRGPGWRFLDIGRRLERALQLIDLLQAALIEAPFDLDPSIEAMLQIADSAITYRSRYFTDLRPEFVLELLLADRANPRSLRFQLAELDEHIAQLAAKDEPEDACALASRALSAVRDADMEELGVRNKEGNFPALENLLQQMKTSLYDISDAIAARYFSHLTTTRLAERN